MACAWQVEIDPAARSVLANHWPDVRRFEDVRQVGAANLAAVDLVCGGFPCQDLSVAGKRAGLDGERSGLWFEFHRIVAELRPQWVVVENVPGLLSSSGGRDFAVILRGLAELGYLPAWRVLDAQHFGVPQRRRRVFIVASLGDGRAAEVLFEPDCLRRDSEAGGEARPRVAASLTAGVSGRGISAPGRRQEDDVNLAAYPIHGTDKTRRVASRTSLAGSIRTKPPGSQENSSTTVVAHTITANYGKQVDSSDTSSGPPNVIIAHTPRAEGFDASEDGTGRGTPLVAYNWQSGGDVRHSFGLPSLHCGQVPAVGVRRLTPTECERLQGFPDGWTAGQSDSARYRQMGNAVAVPVVEWIARRIVAAERDTH